MRTHKDIRDAAVPFPDRLIQQVDTGRGTADYVSWYHYVQRLLATIGSYSWDVTDLLSDDADGWVCVGLLTIDTQTEHYAGVGTDEAYTDSQGKFHRGDPKAAESDAFKRAASKAGYGLHLWAGVDYWLEAQLEKDTPL